MAKRRSKKRSTRRRKSMGAVGGGMTTAITMIAGAVAGRLISSKLKDKVNDKILSGGQIVAGMFLPKLVKNKFMSGIGAGMIVNGGVELISSFGVISGMDSEPSIEYIGEMDEMYSLDDTMSGDDLSIISGDEDFDGMGELDDLDEGIMSGDDLSVISGDDEDDF
jgi:hypothetical protein